MYGGRVYGAECNKTKRCCSRETSDALIGTAPNGVHLADSGCVGDESRQCCNVPAFGETLIASGTLRAIPEDDRMGGVAWELEQVELCHPELAAPVTPQSR